MHRTISITGQAPITFDEEDYPVFAQAGKEDSENFLVLRCKESPGGNFYRLLVYGRSTGHRSLIDWVGSLFRIPEARPFTQYYGAYIQSRARDQDSAFKDAILGVAKAIGSYELGQKALDSLEPREI